MMEGVEAVDTTATAPAQPKNSAYNQPRDTMKDLQREKASVALDVSGR